MQSPEREKMKSKPKTLVLKDGKYTEKLPQEKANKRQRRTDRPVWE